MTEYISRDKAIELIQPRVKPSTIYGEGYLQAIKHASEILALIPAADVQPVKHGRWIPQSDDMWLCSNCKENIIYSCHESDRTEKQRYCCRCGARMIKDGDAE